MTLKADIQIAYDAFELEIKFQLEPGKALGIWGPSGSGKSSIMKVIAGFQSPKSAEIVWNGKPIVSSLNGVNLAPEKRRIGFMLQEPFLFPHYSVNQNLEFGRKHRFNTEQVNLEELVEALDLRELLDRFPRDLSGGEKQRVSLGRVLMTQPDILLLDEPFASLDRHRRSNIMDLIKNLSMTKIVASHNPTELEFLTDELLAIHGPESVQLPTSQAWKDLYEPREAFSLHDVCVTEILKEDHLCLATCEASGQQLYLPLGDLGVGQRVQVRIRARDVSLGLQPIENSSILNSLPAHVANFEEVHPGMVLVRLSLGQKTNRGPFLYAHITKRSQNHLNLQPGDPVHAYIKGMALVTDPQTLVSRSRAHS